MSHESTKAASQMLDLAGVIERLAELTGVTITSQTIRRWRRAGVFPEPMRIGRRHIRWRADVVDAWVATLDQEGK